MTAYVHIGTPKTGTTSIQDFLYLNREKLEIQNTIYANSIESHTRHNVLVNFCFEFRNNSNWEKISFERILKYRSRLKLFYALKEEVVQAKRDFIFSTEGITWHFYDVKYIKILKKFFKELGFNRIILILYLRSTSDLLISLSTQLIKTNYSSIPCFINPWEYDRQYIFNNKWLCQKYSEIFGKENLIVRLFDKNEFFQRDLLKDFIYSIGLKWDDNFVLPLKQNESLDLIGVELCKALNNQNSNYNEFMELYNKYFISKSSFIKFCPPKKIIQSYLAYFEESNEWVRKEFFPHKERLFSKKDLSNYKENYELKEMKPECWDRIAEFIADVVKKKNKIIEDNTNVIQKKDEIIKEKEQIINSKSSQLNQIQSKLSFQTKYGTAKTRIQNQLSYKLGQAMIVNSKSILGYLIMPIALLSIMISHKQEQKIYQEKIKKDPSLKLPPLESYLDYQEALKLKNHLSYKLGQALIKANKTWYKGGYVKMLFEIWKLRKYNI
ncbi:hypothetical protein OJP33_02170 [Campylobacter lari]|uniref:hypothetical protein n=1 Tax=Campylobacter lari TaxID=201 RepID=UPI0021F6F1B0|nr:hypothetical protein [Campylobacter lari]MCW0223520.1 hypothetical protein [Campylobacter lari]